MKLPRGTLLNTATVAVGALVGLQLGRFIPGSYQDVALHALGLVTLALSVKMFLQSKNMVLVAVVLVLGGLLGHWIGIEQGLERFAEWAKQALGAEGQEKFTEGLVTTSILYCIGPMTLLGCLQDALEDKIELLAIKSTMDGIASVFFAAATGAGVLVTAAVVLVFQGALTLLARPLRPIAKDADILAETTATGGLMLAITGFGLLGIASFSAATYLPALALAPLAVAIVHRFSKHPVADH